MPSYTTAITTYLRAFPPGTPLITMTLARDTEKPGFRKPREGEWLNLKAFTAWWLARQRALRQLKTERRL